MVHCVYVDCLKSLELMPWTLSKEGRGDELYPVATSACVLQLDNTRILKIDKIIIMTNSRVHKP